MSCPHAFDDGAYVLGSLPPAERLRFERHLPGCEACTRTVSELAGLPGLLGRIGAEVLENPPEVLPDSVLPALAREVRRSRRRRTWAGVLALAAAAAAVAALVVTGPPADDPAPATSGGDRDTAADLTEAMEPVGGEVPVHADLTVEEVAWGTRLGLTCTYDTESVLYELPPAVDYWLYVRTRDGAVEPVGSWRSFDGTTMRFTGGTAADRADIASVEVRAPNGRVVLRSRL